MRSLPPCPEFGGSGGGEGVRYRRHRRGHRPSSGVRESGRYRITLSTMKGTSAGGVCYSWLIRERGLYRNTGGLVVQ